MKKIAQIVLMFGILFSNNLFADLTEELGPDAAEPRVGATGLEMTRLEATALYRALYRLFTLRTIPWLERYTEVFHVSSCTPGSLSTPYLEIAVNRINFNRQMARLGPVVADLEGSVYAQAAALIFAKNGTLSHNPTPDWGCYTENGAIGAGSSNIARGFGNTVAAAEAFMEDNGASNKLVGHRRWMMCPSLGSVGIGEIDGYPGSHAFKVFGHTTKWVTPPPSVKAVAWPPAGEIPWETLPNNARWSFSQDVIFDNATVEVTDIDGVVIPSSVIARDGSGFCQNTIVFEVPQLSRGAQAYKYSDPYFWRQPEYRVSVRNAVGFDGTVFDVQTYTVRPFFVEPQPPRPMGGRPFYAGRRVGVTAEPSTVIFPKAFQNPIVITGPATTADNRPGNVRIKNIQSDRFEVLFDEWNYIRDGKHGSEIVPFAVFEKGRTAFKETVFEAGRKTISNNGQGLQWFWQSFSQPMSDIPVVIANISSLNDGDAAVVRISGVTKTGFYIALQEQRSFVSTPHPEETVDWVAVDRGKNLDGIQVTRMQVDHVPVDLTLSRGATVFASIVHIGSTAPANVRLLAGVGESLKIYVAREQSNSWPVSASETVNIMRILP